MIPRQVIYRRNFEYFLTKDITYGSYRVLYYRMSPESNQFQRDLIVRNASHEQEVREDELYLQTDVEIVVSHRLDGLDQIYHRNCPWSGDIPPDFLQSPTYVSMVLGEVEGTDFLEIP